MLLQKERTPDLTGYTESAIQKSIFSSAFCQQLPVAAWRLPHQQQQHMIIDLSGSARQVPVELESLPPGFMVSPFMHHADTAQPSYIRADIYYSTGQDRLGIQQAGEQENTFAETVHHFLKEKDSLPAHSYHLPARTAPYAPTDQAHFLALTGKAVQHIEQGVFQKVVPSRRKLVDLPADFDLAATFQKLCQAYPEAFVSIFSIPQVGTWVGASPEILASTYLQHNTKMFRTVALAGTQVKNEQHTLRDVAWRQKEIEEQAMVSRYIINCFKKIRLREFEEIGPKTVAAGNLIHLRTDFTVDTQATHFPELASVMLRLLHPTSAVCGMPKEPSLAFLQQHEAYERAYFSGFLGPVNMRPDELHLFVNLRCMQLLSAQAVLYSGAGVTIDSDPVREWQETEAKMNTLAKVVFS